MSGSLSEALIEQIPMNIPYVSRELLEILKAKYPNELPAKRVDVDTLRELQGQQDVIRLLEYYYSQHHPQE